MFELREYCDDRGRLLYSEWLDSLDVKTRARIDFGVGKMALGNLGDSKSVGGGVVERRFDFGPGYRVYFGRHGGEVIILLIGGDKRSQSKDIKHAQALWRRVQEEKLWHHSKVITKG